MYHSLRKITKKLYLYRGTGLPRLAESIRKLAAVYGPKEPLLIEDFFGSRFYCYLHEHMSGQIFFRGAYSGEQLQVVKELLPPDGVFLDIGANQGEFTIFAARILTAGRVISFEPCSKNLDRLRKNIEINGFGNVEIVPVALGDSGSPALLPLYDQESTFEADGTRNEGMQTLFPSEERSAIADRVVVQRLDDIAGEMVLSKISLIKMDVEGSELFALQGAENTIERFKPPILMEINRETCRSAGYRQEQIVNYLQDLDYNLYRIGNRGERQPLDPNDLDEVQNCLAFPNPGSPNR